MTPDLVNLAIGLLMRQEKLVSAGSIHKSVCSGLLLSTFMSDECSVGDSIHYIYDFKMMLVRLKSMSLHGRMLNDV